MLQQLQHSQVLELQQEQSLAEMRMMRDRLLQQHLRRPLLGYDGPSSKGQEKRVGG